MYEINASYIDLVKASQEGKKAAIRGNVITVGEQGIPITFDIVPGNCIVLHPMFNVANINMFKQTTTMRWMAVLNKWQLLTGLFANYGTEVNEELNQIFNDLNTVRGRIVPVPYDYGHDPDFDILYEIQHYRLYIHCFVHRWARDVIRKLIAAVDRLQAEHPFDTYIYSIKPNIEYNAEPGNISLKFAKMAGYEFLETVVLGDGYEHDIYKRNKDNVTRFIPRNV